MKHTTKARKQSANDIHTLFGEERLTYIVEPPDIFLKKMFGSLMSGQIS